VDRVSFLKGQSREILHFSLLVGLSKMYDTLSAETYYGFIFKVCLVCLKVINIFLLASMKMFFVLNVPHFTQIRWLSQAQILSNLASRWCYHERVFKNRAFGFVKVS
jgi:hypothetical protein